MSSPYPPSHQKSEASPPATPTQTVLKPTTPLEPKPATYAEPHESTEFKAEAWTESEEEFDREALWAGKIMVDNTWQFKWLVYIKDGIETCFARRQDIFVAGDLLWLPEKDDPGVRLVPDVMVVVGRPPHHRSSYKQWEEDNIGPQVVFEVLSPSNNAEEMKKKRGWYEKYGVEEFYLYNPITHELSGYARAENGSLEAIEEMDGWKSPRLGITFRMEEAGLRLYTPDDEPILSALELFHARQQAEMQLEQLQQELEALRQKPKRKKTTKP